MAAQTPITFKVYRDGALIREEEFTQQAIKIGKFSNSHLKLDDEDVSRLHAVIEVTNAGEVSLIDLGSKGGTFVNGEKVNKTKLSSGDKIKVGNTELHIKIGAPVSDEAVQPAPGAAAMPGMQAAAPVVFSKGAPLSNNSPMNASIEDPSGARTVQVEAVFGEDLEGVRQTLRYQGGKASSKTKGLWLAGALAMIVGTVLFLSAVQNAKGNHHSKNEWYARKELKKHRWRPTNLPGFYDLAIGGGLLGGLGLLVFGTIGYRRETSSSPYFRIGTAPEVEYPLASVGADSFPLVAPIGKEFFANFSSDMDVELLNDDGSTVDGNELRGRAQSSQAVSGAMSIAVPTSGRLRIGVGETSFYISSVKRAGAVPAPLFAGSDPTFLYVLGGVAAAAVALFAVVHFSYEDAQATAMSGADKFALNLDDDSNEKDDPFQEEEEEEEADEDSGGTGTAAALEEGKMGKKDSTRATGQFKMEKKSDTPSLARAVDQARNTGIAGALAGGEVQDMFASLTGLSDYSSGFDEESIQGGLLGDEYGEMEGGFGLGRSGYGPGGGGDGWGTIGTGSYGTIGHGSGTGSGFGVGSGSGRGRGRKSVVPEPKIGNANVTGDLDKAIIRRYIRRKLPQIKYCYEKQLLVKKGLAGTVSTKFVISPSGSVTSASGSGVDPTVASCVASTVKSIKFPKPKGGGIVQVKYPFIFRSGS